MSTHYKPIEPEVRDLIDRVLGNYYPELVEAGLTVGGLMAYSDSGHPVKLGGYRCNAVIRIVGPKDRAKGVQDVEIVFDGEMWPRWTLKEKAALIDHELHHVKLVQRNGAVKKDHYDRPLCKMKLHDHQFGWFDEVARRHKGHSFEVQQAKQLIEHTGQLYFPFATGEDLAAEPVTGRLKIGDAVAVVRVESKPAKNRTAKRAEMPAETLPPVRDADAPPEKSYKSITDIVVEKFEAMTSASFLKGQGFSDNVVMKLAHAGIQSGAELRTWVGTEFRKKIPGVGDETAQKIADAVADWMVNQTTAATRGAQ